MGFFKKIFRETGRVIGQTTRVIEKVVTTGEKVVTEKGPQMATTIAATMAFGPIGTGLAVHAQGGSEKDALMAAAGIPRINIHDLPSAADV